MDDLSSSPGAETCGRGGTGVRLEMATLKHGRWSMDGRSSVISRLRQQEAADLGLERHGEYLGRHATTICALPCVTGLVFGSKSLDVDGASLILA
jgi:hypothetical protein